MRKQVNADLSPIGDLDLPEQIVELLPPLSAAVVITSVLERDLLKDPHMDLHHSDAELGLQAKVDQASPPIGTGNSPVEGRDLIRDRDSTPDITGFVAAVQDAGKDKLGLPIPDRPDLPALPALPALPGAKRDNPRAVDVSIPVELNIHLTDDKKRRQVLETAIEQYLVSGLNNL